MKDIFLLNTMSNEFGMQLKNGMVTLVVLAVTAILFVVYVIALVIVAIVSAFKPDGWRKTIGEP